MKQFTTHCKYCGRLILMTRNETDGRWVPCDPEIFRYKRGCGLATYVTTEGKICRGERVGRGYFDAQAEYGYQRHPMSCANVRGNAV